MLKIFLDIETIPDQRDGALQKLIDAEKENFKAPSNLTKTDAIEALKKHGYAFDNDPKFITAPEIKAIYERELAEVMAEPQAREKWHKTGLNGAYGQLLCIGMAVNDGEADVFHLGEDIQTESSLLAAFAVTIEMAIKYRNTHKDAVQFIGHNVWWDLGFLFKRCVINGVKPPVNLQPKRYSDSVIDTMQLWCGHDGRISLGELCDVLGVPTPKDGIDGSQVWQNVQDGNIERVLEYCKADVIATRECYKRLTFK